MRMVLFTFGVFGAAMFTQPAESQVKEVRGLVHLRYRYSRMIAVITREFPFLNCRHQTRYFWIIGKRLNDVNQASPLTVLER